MTVRPSASFCLCARKDGKVGSVVVANKHGQQILSEANQEVTVTDAGVAPGPPRILTDREVQEAYGAAMSALPPPPAHFILYFERDTPELSAASKPIVADVISAVRERTGADVSIVGHTDNTGDRARNFALGGQRAEAVAKILSAQGLDVSQVQVVSHGQDNPLVATGPNTDEPRNRRVEVTVR